MQNFVRDGGLAELAYLEANQADMLAGLRGSTRHREFVGVPGGAFGSATIAVPIFRANKEGLRPQVAILFVGGSASGDATNRKNLNLKLLRNGTETEISNIDLVSAVNPAAGGVFSFALGSLPENKLMENDVLFLEVEHVGSGLTLPDMFIEVSYSSSAKQEDSSRFFLVIEPQTSSHATMEFPIFAYDRAIATIGVKAIPGGDFTGDDADTKNLSLIQYDASGANPVTIGSQDLTDGNDLEKGTPIDFSISGFLTTAEFPVSMKFTDVGTPADLPYFLVEVTYTEQTKRSDNVFMLFALSQFAISTSYRDQYGGIFRSPKSPLSVSGVDIFAGAAVTGASTNYMLIEINETDPAAARGMTSRDTDSGNNFTKMDADPQALLGGAFSLYKKDAYLSWASTKEGSGMVTPPLLFRVKAYGDFGEDSFTEPSGIRNRRLVGASATRQ